MRHVPVLLKEVIESLQLKSGSNVVDCTLGDAGHAEEILKRIAPGGKLLGIDADSESMLRAKNYLHKYDDQVVLIRDNFNKLKEIVKSEKFCKVAGVLMDLGWSSPQFEERKRGFSFKKMDETLDMRYDTHLDCEHVAKDPPLSIDGKPLYGRCTASEHVNYHSEDKLAEIFKQYGEEKFAKEIAKLIVETRKEDPLENVGDLVDIVLSVYRQKLKTDKEIPWVGGTHPATKVFQALRIVVNKELDVLEEALPQAVEVLEAGGRLAVISFHSLEDRIVKHYFKSQKGKSLVIITKKPIIASEEEVKNNPRARSAKLRVIEKL
ncbi:16S rRNA (cytosine(1402)-N(4))-methyltransferase RsmH [Patescibacteria group bacterium]|nr:16S rRNA (cytosine(1402)-N(4))-methyltransferase RsmH [Patescibacteria group bacterium]MBU1895724.1 16S rRNA (cytosine(1402)-N(4))-methyltransferase RsmH [Patescibacteria group bacterium]